MEELQKNIINLKSQAFDLFNQRQMLDQHINNILLQISKAEADLTSFKEKEG